MKHTLQIVVLFLLTLLLAGCTWSKWVASRYLNAARGGEELPYAVAGVSGYTIVDYDIIKQGSGILVVKITYTSTRGNDIVQTKKFEVRDGKLRALDPNDIRETIGENLARLLKLMKEPLDRLERGDSVSVSQLLGRGKNLDDYNESYSVNGEDYNTVVFRCTGSSAYDAYVTDRNGNTVTYHRN
jgi:hypothetical protein